MWKAVPDDRCSIKESRLENAVLGFLGRS